MDNTTVSCLALVVEVEVTLLARNVG
uniref:Uncharacterized protein n=1 Tax=Arundo donax TaxID=35708 RepID=A0A0A9EPX1_ARUDO